MEPYAGARGVPVPLDRADVDTDQIVPKQFLKRVERAGFGRFLFYGWRHGPDGSPRPGFVLDDPAYAGSQVLVSGPNFGCGSSREHAVWALRDAGFRAVVAPSFADIFARNCAKNGLLPARVGAGGARRLMAERGEVEVDLVAQEVRAASYGVPFEVDPGSREALLAGEDDIDRTLRREGLIAGYEARSGPPSVS